MTTFHHLGESIPEDSENWDAVACMRVADCRIIAQGSHQETCVACQAPIWVAPSSPEMPPKYCVECIFQMIGPKQ